MESHMPGAAVVERSIARRPFAAGHALVVLSAIAAILVSLRGILPLPSAFGLLAVLVWFAVPGVVLGRRLYGRQAGGWPAALLAGPAWGYVLSSLVLLGLWAAG